MHGPVREHCATWCTNAGSSQGQQTPGGEIVPISQAQAPTRLLCQVSHDPLHPGNVARKPLVVLMVLGNDTGEQVAVCVIGSTRGPDEGWEAPSQQHLGQSCSIRFGVNIPAFGSNSHFILYVW